MGDFVYARYIPIVILDEQPIFTPTSKLHELEELRKQYERASEAFDRYKKQVEEANRNDN